MQMDGSRPIASRYASFREFYPTYLAEHSRPTTRRLHVIGLGLGLLLLPAAIATQRPGLILAGLAVGYGFAWVSHFFVERNRPATFRHPIYSLMGDFVLLRDVLRGRIPF